MTAPVVDLADALAAPPIARRIADIIRRHAARLELGGDWALSAAARILADPDLTAARRAVLALAELDAAHQPRPWAGSPTGLVCGCGRGAHPCDVRQVIDR